MTERRHEWLREIAAEAERMGVTLMDLDNPGGRARFAIHSGSSIVGYLTVEGEPMWNFMDVLRRVSVEPVEARKPKASVDA